MSLTTSAPAPGWFPDPGDPAQERWWSGEGWTEHARVAESAEATPESTPEPAESAPQPEYVFGMTPQPQHAEPQAARPTLPTLDQLIAAAAQPAETAPVAPQHPQLAQPATTEEWAPKGYGAPADAQVAAASVPPLTAEPVAAFPVPASLALPVEEPAAPAPLPVPASLQLPTGPEAPAGFIAPAHPAQSATAGLVAPESAEVQNPAAAQYRQPTPAPQYGATPAPQYGQAAPAATAMPGAAALPGAAATPGPLADLARPAAGFSSTTDQNVADRYRSAPSGPTAPAPGSFGSPDQPGWGGMPLPAAGMAPGSMAYAPVPTSPAPGYAPCGQSAHDGHNKTAWSAFGAGAIALGLAIVFLFFDRIGLWPALLAIAAVVQGIIGAVIAAKVRKGGWAAALAIVFGLAALGVMGTAAVSWVVDPEYYMSGSALEADMVAYASDYGYEIASASCPDELSGTPGTHHTCTATGTDSTVYTVDVLIDQDGYFVWEILDPAAANT